MCPRQQFRYKPHTMLANYPRLFESKCIRVLRKIRVSHMFRDTIKKSET